jgi:hypothetical protein
VDYLKAIFDLRINYLGTRSLGTLKASKDSQAITEPVSFTTGVAVNKANEIYCKVSTLAAATTLDIDLTSDLTNNLGTTFNPARIKGIALFLLDDTAATSVTVGGYGVNAWLGPFGSTTATQTVFNGGFYANINPTATGWVVTNGTVDKLRIVNNDGAVTATYLLILIGGLT